MNPIARALSLLGAGSLLTASLLAQAPAPGPAGQQPAAPATPQQQNDEILKELRAIRMLLERLTTPPPSRPSAAPQTASVTNLKGYSLGRADAPLTMVEFTDLQCPFCRQFMLTSFDELKKNWIDTGKLRYISRDFPLEFHAEAMPAARAARCAGEQDRFWEMRIALVRNADVLSSGYIGQTARNLKLDMASFDTCTASKKFDAEIQADLTEGMALGLAGTPTFVMGRTTAAKIEGPMLVGALPYAQFDAALKASLAGR